MTKINDGGAAFPTLDHNGQALVCLEFGMTKRDWFAGKALSCIMARPNLDGLELRSVAALSYRIADAMIAARGDA